MSAPNDTQLVEFDGWTLRTRPATTESPRLLLLLHGWTGDENSMWVFARNLSPDYWLIAPRAPHLTEPSGYSWRPMRPGPGPGTAQHSWPSLDDLRPAVHSLIPLVDAYAAKNHIAVEQFDVMGFSQGAALTCALVLLHPERIRRAGVLSGFVPAESESLVAKQPLNGKPFFVAHGTTDDMVDIEYARRSAKMLEAAGASVDFCEESVGHKVGLKCMRALEEFFA